MNNEQFLIASYFTVGVLVVAISLGAYAYLQAPLAGIARCLANQRLGLILERLFPAGLVLPALAAFLSVNYHACDKSYAAIIADRSYLVEENQQQISTACLYLMIATLVWGVVVLISLATQRQKTAHSGQGESDAG